MPAQPAAPRSARHPPGPRAAGRAGACRGAPLRRACVAALACALASCAAYAPPQAPAAGPTVWDVRAQRFVAEDELVAVLVAARLRLLGELHDNPAHHAARAGLVRAIAAAGKRPAVVFEQFTLDHDAPLQAAQRDGAEAERLADAGRLDRKGWAWPLHKPIVEAALAARLPVRAGNLPRSALRADLGARLADSAEGGWVARLRAAPWSEAQQAKLNADIVAGHCDQLPAAAVPRIALAQRARDAAMAEALVTASTADGAVFIAGNGHVRHDLGAPAYLRDAERAGVVAVAFVEADDGEARTPAFARRLAARAPAVDYVWVAPPVAREDPCTRMPPKPPA